MLPGAGWGGGSHILHNTHILNNADLQGQSQGGLMDELQLQAADGVSQRKTSSGPGDALMRTSLTGPQWNWDSGSLSR